jgi:hypothetical protein
MGHRDFKTTLIYTDYAPAAHELEMAERAFQPPAARAQKARSGADPTA